MKGIAIYMEGGGDSNHGKSALRQGMGEFLKELRDKARENRISWKVTACGSRNEAFGRFQGADREWMNLLLVDSEGPMTGNTTAKEHLRRQDRWDTSDQVENSFHLMVQVMETWIISDPEALHAYYGDRFNQSALPSTANLENVTKVDVQAKLKAATQRTQKGEYHKILHAQELLSRIDPEKVRRRCHHCELLFTTLEQIIEAAR